MRWAGWHAVVGLGRNVTRDHSHLAGRGGRSTTPGSSRRADAASDAMSMSEMHVAVLLLLVAGVALRTDGRTDRRNFQAN